MKKLGVKTINFSSLITKAKELLSAGPDAHDLAMVDDYFHELRHLSTQLISAFAEVQTELAKCHFNYLVDLDLSSTVAKITKASSTLTNNVCNANCSELYTTMTELKEIINLVDSTFIQYNTLVSANKRFG